MKKLMIVSMIALLPLSAFADEGSAQKSAAQKSSKPVKQQKMLVDMADTQDVQSFQDAEGAISLYAPLDGSLGGQVNTYTDASGKTVSTAGSNTIPAAAKAAMDKNGHFDAGQRINIRERYTLTPETSSALFSPTSVINVLTKQMAGYCPNGWTKIKEWSEPVEKDFYMYYTVECR